MSTQGPSISECTLEELSGLDNALARREASLLLERRTVEGWIKQRIDSIAESRHVRLNLPEEGGINRRRGKRDNAIRSLKRELGAATARVLDQLEDDIPSAEEDLRLAREFAQRNGLAANLTAELMSFELIINHRKENISQHKKEVTASYCLRPSELPEPPKTRPVTPAYPSQGFQYEGFGSDVALELCTTSLEDMDQFVRQGDECIGASVTEPVLWTVAYARERGLIPPE